MAKIPELVDKYIAGDSQGFVEGLNASRKEIKGGIEKLGKFLYQGASHEIKKGDPASDLLLQTVSELASLGTQSAIDNVGAVAIAERYGYDAVKVNEKDVALDSGVLIKKFQAGGEKAGKSYVDDFAKGVLGGASPEEKAILGKAVELGKLYGDLKIKGAVPGKSKFGELINTYAMLKGAEKVYSDQVVSTVIGNANQVVELRKASVNAKYGGK